MAMATEELVKAGEKPNLTDNAITVLERRYLKKDTEGNPVETPKDMFARVAVAVAAADAKYDQNADVSALAKRFYELMARREFLPNSPTLMNAGRELGQLSACFVLPIGDSMESIFEAVKNTALIHKSGGGTGFSFSSIRPKNDVVNSTNGVSSGPISFMKVFDTATEMIKQGGTRRGANMGILRVDHPDIEEFIGAKSDTTLLTNFNLSVAITESFMEAVHADQSYALLNPRSGQVVKKLRARDVYDQIVQAAWATGEPGIVFIDRMNRDNPTPAVGKIESTNPCGEQPLLSYESCNLGSVNLSLMVGTDSDVDWEKLKGTVHDAVHFLDNVVDINQYPLKEISDMTRSNRKIGLGVMGFADMLFQMGVPYGSRESFEIGEKVMSFIDQEALEASRELARIRGPFPNYPKSVYNGDGGIPVRNATRTTIAPTGTISIIGNCSSGIEPLFSLAFVRRVMDGTEMIEINPIFKKVAMEKGFYTPELMGRLARGEALHNMSEIPEDIREVFVTAHDINPEQHIRMQAAFQGHTNNAVSKTVNFPETASRDEVAEVFQLAYKMGCKGVTIYRDNSRAEQVLSTRQEAKAEEKQTQDFRPKKRERPNVLEGKTFQMKTGCGPLYITINEDKEGLFEVFTTMGKAGGCAASQCEALGRLVSLSWRFGVDVDSVVRNLRGISCHKPAGFGPNRVLSCADALALAVQSHYNPHKTVEKPVLTAGACPECGDAVEHEEGCLLCRSCGYSECG